MAGYYDRRFGVKLDPDREVIATLGLEGRLRQSGAGHHRARRRDHLVPNPAYPIHAFGFILAGGVIRHVSLRRPGTISAGLGRAVRHSVPPPIALVVSYPSNPTAQVVDLDFYKDVVAFAKKHEIWVLSDLAYSEIYFDENDPPPSILQVDGRQGHRRRGQLAVEDLRHGGLARRHCRRQRAHDRGARRGSNPISTTAPSRRSRSRRRRRSTGRRTASTRSAPSTSPPRRADRQLLRAPGGTFPRRRVDVRLGADARGISRPGLDRIFQAAAANTPTSRSRPVSGFGEYGDGYVRIALVENEQRIRQAARNVRKFLSGGPSGREAKDAAQ